MKPEKPFLTDPKHIKAWLNSLDVKRWSINSSGLVDVEGSVFLGGKLGSLTKLPIRFGTVGGDFNCWSNKLACLEGAPKEVGGNFYCYYNRLVNLNGSPVKVDGAFNCERNKLVSLEGAPREIGWNFFCGKNLLVNLQGAPYKVGSFNCGENQLVSLEGAPKVVDGWFTCNHNLLKDFKGLEGTSIRENLCVAYPSESRMYNVFVSLDGLPKELYSKVEGLDVRPLLGLTLELEGKRAASLLGNEVAGLSSEVELG